jgi:hypothetical protein
MTSKSGVNYTHIRKMKRGAGSKDGEPHSATAGEFSNSTTGTAKPGDDEVLILDAEQPPPLESSSSATGPGEATAGCTEGYADSGAAPENDEGRVCPCWLWLQE